MEELAKRESRLLQQAEALELITKEGKEDLKKKLVSGSKKFREEFFKTLTGSILYVEEKLQTVWRCEKSGKQIWANQKLMDAPCSKYSEDCKKKDGDKAVCPNWRIINEIEIKDCYGFYGRYLDESDDYCLKSCKELDFCKEEAILRKDFMKNEARKEVEERTKELVEEAKKEEEVKIVGDIKTQSEHKEKSKEVKVEKVEKGVVKAEVVKEKEKKEIVDFTSYNPYRDGTVAYRVFELFKNDFISVTSLKEIIEKEFPGKVGSTVTDVIKFGNYKYLCVYDSEGKVKVVEAVAKV